MQSQLLSIVIPLFNEENNLTPLVEKLTKILTRLTTFENYEILLVNDGSTDGSLIECKKLVTQNPNIKIISFLRNFGHEYATFAGIKYASGDALVLIDADGQDPAELILEFEKEFIKGYEIVFGQRTKRLSETHLKKITSSFFYPVFKYLTNVDLPHSTGDFCMLSRKVVDIIKNMPEKAIFIRGLIYWTGLPKKAVPFIRLARASGKTKYNYFKLTVFALENIISFSTKPIYFAIFFSLSLMLLCVLGIIGAISIWLMGFVKTIGWTSLIITMLFSLSVTMFFLGILGLYIGKIFHEIKQRPVFLVDEFINFDNRC